MNKWSPYADFLLQDKILEEEGGVLVAGDAFRKRRIEKNLTREQMAEQSGVAVSNIVRFEQKGLISLKNLIGIAMAFGYTSEIVTFSFLYKRKIGKTARLSLKSSENPLPIRV